MITEPARTGDALVWGTRRPARRAGHGFTPPEAAAIPALQKSASIWTHRRIAMLHFVRHYFAP